jgi:hypothetical protein
MKYEYSIVLKLIEFYTKETLQGQFASYIEKGKDKQV